MSILPQNVPTSTTGWQVLIKKIDDSISTVLPDWAAYFSYSATNGVTVSNEDEVGALLVQRAAATGSAPVPVLQVSSTDSFTTGSGFAIAASIVSETTGGDGHREALHIEQISNASAYDEFVVGATGIGRIKSGSGQAFGLNGYAWVDAAADDTASAVGCELNTDARGSVVTKAGLQIVDVATSTAAGTVYDAGIIIGAQAGAARYAIGIQFGFTLGGDSQYAIHSGGALIEGGQFSGSLAYGINLSGLSGSYTYAPILLRPANKGIWWGTTREGGAIESTVVSNAGRIEFTNNGVSLLDNSGTTTILTTGGYTYLSFFTGTGFILRRIVALAADSGGAGYRQILVEN